MMIATVVSAEQSRSNRPTLDIAISYEGTLAHLVSDSHLSIEGGNAEVHGRFYVGWG
jgi:hypothetical protein